MDNKCRSKIDETVAYYDENATAFIGATINADVSKLYSRFEKTLTPGCKILDLGCGSGRDSRYFLGRGYDVVAVDPSSAMCEQTRSLVDIPVIKMKAEDIRFSSEFDAVWACASLLHVSRDDQEETLLLIGNALKAGGICYCSWKYGNEDRVIDGRHFTDFTEKSFRELLTKIRVFEEEEVWITHDVRDERYDQKWLNVLIRKRRSCQPE